MTLSIIIPAFNEEERLPAMLFDLKNVVEDEIKDIEIIIVNDGSEDNTMGVAREFAEKWGCIKIINSQENEGKGASVKKGMLKATGEYRIFADADGATPFKEIKKLFKEIDNGSDIAIASRAMKESDTRTKWYLKFRGRVFNFLVNSLLNLKLSDMQCGFKLFKGEVAQKIFSEQKLNGFAFDIEILYKAKKHGYKITEVPVVWNSVSGSKVNPILDPIRMFFSIFVVKFFS